MSRQLKIVQNDAGIVAPPQMDFTAAPTRNHHAAWNSRPRLVLGAGEDGTNGSASSSLAHVTHARALRRELSKLPAVNLNAAL
jgi:hypothetical protein